MCQELFSGKWQKGSWHLFFLTFSSPTEDTVLLATLNSVECPCYPFSPFSPPSLDVRTGELVSTW